MGDDGLPAQATVERIRGAVGAYLPDGGLRGSARRVARRRFDSVMPLGAIPTTPRAARRADDDYGQPATPDWREIDWRPHLHDIEVEGRSVRYVDVGSGDAPPVVFIHGLGGNWQNWLENIPWAASGRRVLALDLPGFGESPMPAREISIPGYAELIEAWLDRLAVGHVVLVGNSMGGFISAEVAIDFPARVERQALVAAAGISIANVRRRPARTVARLAMAAGALTASRSREVIARERLRHAMMATVFRHPSRMRPDLLFEVLRGSGPPGFVDALEALTTYDFRHRLPQIDCPTLIVWGREDVLVPVRDAEEFERLIPRSQGVILDDTGHVPMLERPEVFNRCLERFLTDESPEPRIAYGRTRDDHGAAGDGSPPNEGG